MFIVRAAWSDAAGTCVVVGSDPSLLNVLYFYSKLECPPSTNPTIMLLILTPAMGFDFVILVCTFLALSTKHTARTDLWKLLFTDGLVYFLVTFSANCIPAVSITSFLCQGNDENTLFPVQVLNVLNLNSEFVSSESAYSDCLMPALFQLSWTCKFCFAFQIHIVHPKVSNFF